MLAKKYRLTGNTNFKRVEVLGVMYQSSNFGIGMFNRKDEEVSRYGFVISTKVAKDAVDRNTIRRHMSETVRRIVQDVKNGYDVVFLAKTSIIRTPAEELVKEVRHAIRESGLLK